MRVRRLSWAGVQLESGSVCAVIDAIDDTSSMDEWVGPPREDLWPAPRAGEVSVAAVTHLHRDHTDPVALKRLLAPPACVLRPAQMEGGILENASMKAAEDGLAELEVPTRAVDVWETVDVGPFVFTALPASDGTGDPQVHWLVQAGGHSVLHAGDTLWHAGWWRYRLRYGKVDAFFAPINAAVTDFPHRQPASGFPAVMTPEQAVAAAAALDASVLVPIHYALYHKPPHYVALENAEERLLAEAARRSVEVRVMAPGEEIDLAEVGQSAGTRGAGLIAETAPEEELLEGP